jgi:serine/tyrosine/threonine adenylyltransferase
MDARVKFDTLDALSFDNRVTDNLPADLSTLNRSREVSDACFSRVNPESVSAPQLVAVSDEMLEALNLSKPVAQSDQFAQVFAGNQLLPGMDSYAWCYGGHQFGNWAGQLGDGRAINLGEVQTTSGEHWVLQLKGAGLTPYSRTADGGQ